MKNIFTLALVAATSCLYAQTVYVPSGTSGIGTNSTNSFVGIGTGAAVPDEMLHVYGNIRLGQPTATTPTTYFINVAQGGSTINSGNGRGLTVQAGSTDNAPGKIGGLLTLTGGAPTSPSTAFGHVAIAPNNGFVGIGTTAPTSKLMVTGGGGAAVDLRVNGRITSGDGGNAGGVYVNSAQTLFVGQNGANQIGLYAGAWRLVATDAGNVGIGNSSPTARLDVTGLGGGNIDFKVNGRMLSAGGGLWVDNSATLFFGQATTSSLGLWAGNAWRLVADATGNIGIGTTTPDARLAVKGLIHTQEVKVDLTGAVAPDYVFDKHYDLPSLEKIKQYIDKNHHLPEIPSAKEIEANGINLGEMNLLLLKKIEELTLHMIRMSEENEILRGEIKDIKSSLKK